MKEKVQAGDVVTIDKATGKITKLGKDGLTMSIDREGVGAGYHFKINHSFTAYWMCIIEY